VGIFKFFGNYGKTSILDCYRLIWAKSPAYCWADLLDVSAGPNKGSLLSVIVGSVTSMQIGLESIKLKKLHSFLVAAEAACSKGDFPVAAVDARLAAVPGLATAAAPTLLAAAVPEVLRAANGAAQPLRIKMHATEAEKATAFSVKQPVLF
jgi:hypothetical protein